MYVHHNRHRFRHGQRAVRGSAWTDRLARTRQRHCSSFPTVRAAPRFCRHVGVPRAPKTDVHVLATDSLKWRRTWTVGRSGASPAAASARGAESLYLPHQASAQGASNEEHLSGFSGSSRPGRRGSYKSAECLRICGLKGGEMKTSGVESRRLNRYPTVHVTDFRELARSTGPGTSDKPQVASRQS